MKNIKKRNIRLISNLLLVLTALIWGIAFVAQSVGMDHVGPWTFSFYRYIVSTIVLIPVAMVVGKKQKAASSLQDMAQPYAAQYNTAQHNMTPNDEVPQTTALHSAGQPDIAMQNTPQESGIQSGTRQRLTWKDYLMGGISCGVFLASASISQQAGLQYTSAGKAGFITALYVVLVPVLGLLFRKKPEKKIWICVLLGLCGLYLISVKEGFTIESGDALVMLCALLFACQILCVDYFSARLDNLVLLADLQFATVTVISFIGMLLFESPTMADLLDCAVPILYAGLFSGAVGYTLQMVAQKNTDPAVASLIMSLESVFSALSGWVILGQMLSGRELIGCALVMAAVVLAQVPLHLRRSRSLQ